MSTFNGCHYWYDEKADEWIVEYAEFTGEPRKRRMLIDGYRYFVFDCPDGKVRAVNALAFKSFDTEATTARDVVTRMSEWNQKHQGWNGLPHVPELYDCLGSIPHKGKTIPKDYEETFFVDEIGVVVKVYASGKRRLHRVFILCPQCGREVDAGHFWQHKCRKKTA